MTQRQDTCPDCGATRTELAVAPGRFYCPHCQLAGPGPNQSAVPGAQLDLFHQPIEPATALASEQLAGAARAIALGEPPEESVLLRGLRIADAALEVAREHGRRELHYREWFELVRRAGYLIGGANPEASFLTALHRHPAVESVGDRTGLWRIPETDA